MFGSKCFRRPCAMLRILPPPACARAIGFVLIALRARMAGMLHLPWGLAVIATACIALLFMVARLLWLESGATRRP
jgi:hypothetical protein